jgi:hypothetical protein
VFSLLGCGHPIRDLADGVKELIPDDEKKTSEDTVAPTTRIALIANLYADAPLAPTWDASKPEASSSFIVSGSPFTREGHVDLRLCFAKVDAHSWRWHAVASAVGAGSSELGRGLLVFTAEGALESASVEQALRLPLRDGSLSAPIDLFLGTPVGRAADGFDGVTASAETSRLVSYEQDGGARD